MGSFQEPAEAWQQQLQNDFESKRKPPVPVEAAQTQHSRLLPIQEVMLMMRHAPCLYPEAPEVRKIPHYQKFNRADQGQLRVGSAAPDAQVRFLDGALTSLRHFADCTGSGWNSSKPLVLCAGSYS